VKAYYDDGQTIIYHADCQEVLPMLGSVDLVLTDPPYGITSNEWDIEIAASQLLSHFSLVVMTASQPFAARMIVADIERFRHEWIWIKNRGSNFANTVREPMKEHEAILVFADRGWTYNKQMQERSGSGASRAQYEFNFRSKSENYREFEGREGQSLPAQRVPSSWQKFNTEVGLHPTQKPVALFEYLTLTYSNEGDTVLDPFMGSGTTIFAAKKLGRKGIGIEIEERYCEIAVHRISNGRGG